MESLSRSEAELLVPLETNIKKFLIALLPRQNIDTFVANYEGPEEDLSSSAEDFTVRLESMALRQDGALLARANAEIEIFKQLMMLCKIS